MIRNSLGARKIFATLLGLLLEFCPFEDYYFESDVLMDWQTVVISVSLENINTDVAELDKGMEAVRKEAEIRGRGSHGLVVRDFLANAEDKLRRLRCDAKLAQEAFRECVEFFAESPRTTDANSFFSLLVRFAKAFKVSI